MQRNDNLVITNISGDLRQGGWYATGYIDGDTDAVVFGQNVRLVGRSYSETDDIDWREYLNGHVLETPSYSFDVFTSRAGFRVGTANYLMTGQIQDVAFTEQASPANDHQIAVTMTLSDCFSHLVERHCNFVYNATEAPDGIIFTTDINTSDTALTRFNFNKSGNMWSALVSQLGGGEEGGVQFFRPYFTRENVLVYQPAPLFESPALTSKGTLTKEHIRGRPQVTIRNAKAEDRVGQVEIVAVRSANTVYTSKYPSAQPGDGKIVVKDSGIWADSQARADTLAQNLYEWLTRPYTLRIEVDAGLVLFGDDGDGLELGDRVTVDYDGPTEDAATGAGTHIDFNNQDFYIYKVDITFDVSGKIGRAILELEADN